MSVFGPLVDGGQVEAWTRDILRTWMATYLGELERRTARTAGSLPLPRSYVTVNDFTHWPEDQIPAVIIVSPGLASEPTRRGSGDYAASWVIDVGVVVSASTRGATRDLAKLCALAVRAALLQHRSLDGNATNVDWLDESYDDLPSDPQPHRTLAAGLGRFHVAVDGVVNTDAGTARPDPPPDPAVAPADWPTVTAGGVTVTVEKENT